METEPTFPPPTEWLYEAMDAYGVTIRGSVSAVTEDEVAKTLRQRGLFICSINKKEDVIKKTLRQGSWIDLCREVFRLINE